MKDLRWIDAKVKAIGPNGDLVVVLTDETTDRAGDIILADAWDFENYKKNPVVLWAHDYKQLPIGKMTEIWREGGKHLGRIEFAPHEFAQQVKELYQQGYLNSVSVGFLPKEYDYNKDTGGYIYKKVELLEVSAVPVPANPNAVAVLEARGMLPSANTNRQKGGDEVNTETKGVIPYKKHPLAPEDTKWDAPREVKKADVNDLKVMCSWYDEQNPDVKQSYKLPHHLADKEKNYPTVWRGVATAMAVLFGARGGVNIPEKDKKGVYQHLAKHYEDFGKEPPEWGKSWEEVKDYFSDITEEEIDAMIKAVESGEDQSTLEIQGQDEQEPTDGSYQEETEKSMDNTETKAGAVLSRRNAEKLLNLANKVEEAIKVLDEAVTELTDFVQTATKNTNDNGTDEKMYTKEEVKEMINEALNTYREELLKELGGETDD